MKKLFSIVLIAGIVNLNALTIKNALNNNVGVVYRIPGLVAIKHTTEDRFINTLVPGQSLVLPDFFDSLVIQVLDGTYVGHFMKYDAQSSKERYRKPFFMMPHDTVVINDDFIRNAEKTDLVREFLR